MVMDIQHRRGELGPRAAFKRRRRGRDFDRPTCGVTFTMPSPPHDKAAIAVRSERTTRARRGYADVHGSPCASRRDLTTLIAIESLESLFAAADRTRHPRTAANSHFLVAMLTETWTIDLAFSETVKNIPRKVCRSGRTLLGGAITGNVVERTGRSIAVACCVRAQCRCPFATTLVRIHTSRPPLTPARTGLRPDWPKAWLSECGTRAAN